jgi:medium-chain acyl-[acyl-carrier-protein] hydrolase
MPILGVRLAGREQRMNEPPCRDWDSLLAPLVKGIGESTSPGVTLFGHCLGGAIAYELAVRLGPHVRHLVVAGCLPPFAPASRPALAHLPTRELFVDLIRRGNAPEEILGDDAFMEMVEPAVRSDIVLAETWRPDRSNRLSIPITVLAGQQDQNAPLAAVQGWSQWTTAKFALHEFPGGHFFLKEHRSRILDIIVAQSQPQMT